MTVAFRSRTSALEPLKKLVLGTASLGLPYGLSRDGGPPTLMPEAVASRIIKGALSGGLSTFDTAPAYGAAEERLGHALGAAGSVWTKVGQARVAGGDFARLASESLGLSIGRLARPGIELLQWHNWDSSLADDRSFRTCWENLASDSRVGALGASTYGVADALAAVNSGLFKVVQVEWNLLNQAVVDAIAEPAERKGVAIAARSVFLQGALADERLSVPEVPVLRKGILRARAVAASLQVPLGRLALRTALDHPAIRYVLVGIDGEDQIAHAVAVASAPLPPCDPELIASLSLGSNAAVDPRAWPQARSRLGDDGSR